MYYILDENLLTDVSIKKFVTKQLVELRWLALSICIFYVFIVDSNLIN